VKTNGEKMTSVELPLDPGPTVTKCHSLSAKPHPDEEFSRKHFSCEEVEEDLTENKRKVESNDTKDTKNKGEEDDEQTDEEYEQWTAVQPQIVGNSKTDPKNMPSGKNEDE
jgi:hypothetical protein